MLRKIINSMLADRTPVPGREQWVLGTELQTVTEQKLLPIRSRESTRRSLQTKMRPPCQCEPGQGRGASNTVAVMMKDEAWVG